MAQERIGIANIELVQNENYTETMDLQDVATSQPFAINTSSYVVMEIKEHVRQHSIIKLTLGDGLTIQGTNNLHLFISSARTRRLSGRIYHYDILFGLDGGADPVYLIKGQINVINTNSRQQ